MPLPVVASATGLVAAGIAWTIRLSGAPEPFGVTAAAVVAADLIVLALIAVAGITLRRARWSLWTAIALLGYQATLAATTPSSTTGTVATVATGTAAVATAALLGLGWFKTPAAKGPPPTAVALLLGLVAYPGVIAASQPSEMNGAQLAASALSIAGAFALSRGGVVGLWTVRLAFPVGAAWAVMTATSPGIIAIAVTGLALTLLAWSKSVGLAAVPLLAGRAPGYRIPPELAPPEVLDAAGLDRHGRRRR